MRSAVSENRDRPWLDFRIDEKGLEYARTTQPAKLAWEAIGGTLLLVATWTMEARGSSYPATDDTVFVEHVVISAVLDELIATCRELARGNPGPHPIVLHGTPLELLVQAHGEKVKIDVLEYPGYSDNAVTLGSSGMSRSDFLSSIGTFADRYLAQLVAENPSLADHPAAISIQLEAENLRKRV